MPRASRAGVWHLARTTPSGGEGARLTTFSYRRRPLKTVNTNRGVGYLRKANSLRHLCGGRLHRWLALWVLGRERGSTPWPGWPASRLILARYVPENCSSPSTDRVTTDTTMFPPRCTGGLSRRAWQRRRYAAISARSASAAHPWGTHSKASSSLLGRGAELGAGKLQASRVRSARPLPKRSLQHCWARGYAS